MGSTAYQSFYKYVLRSDISNNLTKEIERITETGEYNNYKDIPIIPIQHSSGANPRFNTMLKSEKLIELIKRIINTDLST